MVWKEKVSPNYSVYAHFIDTKVDIEKKLFKWILEEKLIENSAITQVQRQLKQIM